MQQLYAWIAVDDVAARRREATRHRGGPVVVADRRSTAARRDPFRRRLTPSLTRTTARVLAAVTRTTAATVRRLDACIADDLGRALAPGE